MQKMMLLVVSAGAALAAASSAHAEGGCGPAFHRGPGGGCLPNGGRAGVVVAPGAVAVVGVPTIGVFYPGRGYWDGHRYWANRYRWHGGWRYR